MGGHPIRLSWSYFDLVNTSCDKGATWICSTLMCHFLVFKVVFWYYFGIKGRT